MISYDKYQNRIRRIATVKNFIVRFRALFIAFFALLVALSLALIFTKGMITREIVMPDKIIYGDSYGDSILPPKAFLSRTSYQFRQIKDDEDAKSSVRFALTDDEVGEEDEWTEELPKLAGRYLVRTASNTIFGKKYSDSREFEIETYSTEFIINSDSIVYGETPDSYTIDLVNGDRLIVEGLTFDYENPSSDITDICANSDSFKILNAMGEDVTFCYNISVPTKEGVVIARQDITLTPQSLTLTYSGTEIVYENPALSVKGGTAQIKTRIYDSEGNLLAGNPVYAGVYTAEIIPEQTKVYSGDDDVTKHYNISYETATITINKRHITVISGSGSKEYDGKVYLHKETVIYDGLLPVHNYILKYEKDLINAGKYENECEFIIYDKDRENVTANYEIEYVFGEIEITPREIKLTTHDAAKVYDGVPFDETSFSMQKDGEDALVAGHSAIPVYNYRDYNAGTYVNEITVRIVDDRNYDVTDNYEIEYEYGALEILKREISITSATDSWVYDGNEHSNTQVSLLLHSELGEIDSALADGDEIYVAEFTEVAFFTPDGEQNVIGCKILKDGEDVTDNYDIKYVWGTLKIEKRPLVITTPSISKVYDGTPLLGTEEQSYADNLAWCDWLGMPDEVASLINCGEIENATKFNVLSNYLSDLKTSSYDITYVNGTLEVTVRDITVTTPTLDKFYDGEPLMGDRELPKLTEIENHVFRPFDVSQRTDAGEVTNTTQYKISRLDEDGEWDVTECFNISYEYGTLTVNRRNVWVLTATAQKEYDGTPLIRAEGWEDTDYPENQDGFGLVENHVLKVDKAIEPSSITDVDSIPNAVYFKVFFEANDVSENYYIRYSFGTLTVTQRIILITTADDEWTYDAGLHSNGNATAVHGSGSTRDDFVPDNLEAFVPGHTLALLTAREVTTVGSYENFCVYDITDESGESIISNYYLIIKYGTLTVNPRPIIITTHSGDRVFDDTPFTYISADAEGYDGENERGILSGHGIVHDEEKFTASVTFVKEGKVENELHYRIFGGEGEVTENYKIEYVYGKIHVTARPITIITATSHSEFDGNVYSDIDGYDVAGEYGIVNNHYLVAEEGYATVQFVTDGEIKNKVSYRVEREGVDLTDNYGIEYEYGKIWLTVRSVLITTNTNSWTYDGEAHSDAGYKEEHINAIIGTPDKEAGLVLGHKLAVVGTPAEVKNYTEDPVENIVDYIVENEQINKNYALTVVYGYLSISKRPVIITTATKDKVYDGNPFSWTEDWIAEGGEVKGQKLTFGLVAGHTLAVVEIKAEIVDVLWKNGEISGIQNEIVYKVVDENGSDKINVNYEIVEYIYGTLTRTPRPIIIYTDDARKKYDGTPLECENFLCEASDEANTRGLLNNKNHKAVLDTSKPAASITYITAQTDSKQNARYYLIMDGAGNVTPNYEISYEYGTLTILPRALKIKTATNSWNYDGQPHYDLKAEFEGLVSVNGVMESWVAIDETITKIIDFKEGGVKNATEYRIFTNENVETTYCYDISYAYGTIAIDKTDLKITTLSPTKVYDGTPLMGNDAHFDDNLDEPVFEGKVDGETYESYNVTELTDAGTGTNLTEYYIFANRNGTIVETTGNYNISYTKGTLTVNRREITIRTKTESHEYDGEEFSCTDGWEDIGDLKLVEGHTLAVVSSVSIINVGSAENKVTYKVVDSDGNDEVNKNYEINYEYGYITVTSRNILVTTDDGEWFYDADKHSKPFEKAVHCSITEEGDFVPDEKETFVLGHILRLLTASEEVEANTYKNVCTYDVVDGNGGSVLSNYNLIVVYGNLTIKPRPIIVKTLSAEKEYDGTELECREFKEEEYGTDRGLLVAHEVRLINQNYVKIVNVLESGAENVFEVIIVDGNERDVTSNYDIKYEYGELTITKRIVHVKTGSGEWTYDAEKHSNPSEQCVHGRIADGGDFVADEKEVFVSGHILSRLTVREVLDVGSYKNVCTYDVIDGNEDSVLSNYNLIVEYGELVIEKLAVTIRTASLEKVYDGTPLYGDKDLNAAAVTVNEAKHIEGLAGDDEARSDAEIAANLTYVGTLENKNFTKYKIFSYRDGGWVDISDNYEIDYTYYGTLTVTKRHVTIETATSDLEFDGKPYCDTHYEITDGNFVVEDNFVILNYATVTYVTEGKIPNTFEYCVRNGEREVTENYDITLISGMISRTVRYIQVRSNDKRWTYDGKSHDETGYSSVHLTDVKLSGEGSIESGTPDGAEGLVLGHELKVVTSTFAKDFTLGTENVVTYEFKTEGVSENYCISFISGTLIVDKRELNIVLNTVNGMIYGNSFEGYPSENGMYTYAEGSLQTVEGEELKITIKYKLDSDDITDTSKLNAGVYSVVLDTVEIENGSIDNYAVTAESTLFEVARRSITIAINELNGVTYNGYEFEFVYDAVNGFKTANEDDIVEGDELIISVKYLLGGKVESTPLNAGTYILKFDEDGCKVNGDTTLALNYKITCANDGEVSLVIARRALIFEVGDLSHEYTGVAYYKYEDGEDSLTFDESQLADTDKLTNVSALTKLNGEYIAAVDIGVYDFVIDSFEVLCKKDGSDATQNYYLSKNQIGAHLTITKRVIKVSVVFSDIASRDFTGEEIDLVKEYPSYGPYVTEPVSEKFYSWGIYAGDQDKIEAVFSFTKDGVSAELRDLGTYNVSVTLRSKAGYNTIDSYECIYEADAVAQFMITRRRINIIPKMTAVKLEYDGKKLDSRYLDYDTKHFFSYEEGFLFESDRADYRATYSLYEVGGNGENLIDEVLQAGNYYIKIKLEHIEGNVEQYLITEVFNSDYFTVYPRSIYANTPDDNSAYVYNKTSADTPEKYDMYYKSDEVWTKGVFLVEDFKDAAPIYAYYKDDERFDCAVDAGEYTIKVVGFDGPNSEYIARNYLLETDLEEEGEFAHGKLIIKPAILVVVPKDYSEPYTGGEILELPSDSYVIKYVEGNNNPELFGADTLSFTASGTVNIRKTNIARITFKEVRIFDGDRDVTFNYDIAHTYTQMKAKFPGQNYPEELKSLKQADFGAFLSFEQIQLTVFQPSAPVGSVVYGTNAPLALEDKSITVKNAGDLLDGHRVIISTARVVATETDYVRQWVYVCKVYDGNGAEITMGYSITIECGEDSWIRVKPRSITIKVDYEEGEREDGELSPGEYTIVEGSIVFGAVLTVTVENGKYVAKIASRVGDDYTAGYSVNFEYKNKEKEAEDASRIYLLLSRRAEIIREDDLSQ